MQVRARGASGPAAKCDKLPSRHFVAFLGLELREMHVNRDQALAMIQHDAISFEIKRPCQDHTPRVRRVNRRAYTRAEIEPQVLALFHAVVDAGTAEDAGSLGLCRILKRHEKEPAPG